MSWRKQLETLPPADQPNARDHALHLIARTIFNTAKRHGLSVNDFVKLVGYFWECIVHDIEKSKQEKPPDGK